MKITKRRLRVLIKEEMHDCIKDYMRTHGYSRAEAGKECGEEESASYSGYSRPRYQRRTSYVGSDANADQIEAVEASLAIRSNNFLTSVLRQLKNGRGLSGKQKSIVKNIIGKQNPEAASLFESRITKRQLGKIIKEERTKLIRESVHGRLDGELTNLVFLAAQEVDEEYAEITVQDVVDTIKEMAVENRIYLDDERLKDYFISAAQDMTYEDVVDRMHQLVQMGDLTDGHEDFFYMARAPAQGQGGRL